MFYKALTNYKYERKEIFKNKLEREDKKRWQQNYLRFIRRKKNASISDKLNLSRTVSQRMESEKHEQKIFWKT